MSIQKTEILARFDDFLSEMPSVTSTDSEWERWYLQVVTFIKKIGGIPDPYARIFTHCIIEKYRHEGIADLSKQIYPAVLPRELRKNMLEHRRAGFEHAINVLKDYYKETIPDDTVKTESRVAIHQESVHEEGNLFKFGNSITDCDTHCIWRDGDKSNCQKFSENAKRRHVWEYCRMICGGDSKTQAELDQHVSEKLGRKEHVTEDDMKGLCAIIARISDVPLKQLRKENIVFEEGGVLRVKKVH